MKTGINIMITKKKLRNRITGIATGTAGVGYATIRGIKDTNKGKNIIDSANDKVYNQQMDQYTTDKNKYIVDNGGKLDFSPADKENITMAQFDKIKADNERLGKEYDASHPVPVKAERAKGIKAWWTGFKNRIGTNWNKSIDATKKWWNGLSTNQRLFTAAGMGATGSVLAYGAYKLWRKRHDKRLREDVEVNPYYFDNSTMAALSECLLELPDDDVVDLIESDKEGISDITNNIILYLVETSLEDSENNKSLYQYYTESLTDAGSKISSSIRGDAAETIGSAKNAGSFVAKHKMISGIAGGTAAVETPLATKRVRKEQLYESYYFDDDHMNSLVESLNSLSDDQIQNLLESPDPIISRITNNVISYVYSIKASNITESIQEIPGDITIGELLGGVDA